MCSDNKWLEWGREIALAPGSRGLPAFRYETRNSYMLSKVALRERFEPRSNWESYKVEFRNWEWQSTESWTDFGDTMLSLVDWAFLDLPDNAKEALALDRFLSHLNSLQTSFTMRQCKTRCVREAVYATLDAESHLIAHHSDNHQKQHNELLCKDKPPATIATDPHFQQLERMVETLKDIQLKIANCEITPVFVWQLHIPFNFVSH